MSLFDRRDKNVSKNELLIINRLLGYGNKRSEFDVTDQLFNNPYKGFTDFNHFDDGKIFADSVDGWKKEKYPLYDDLDQSGAKTGFYPKCSIAYVRTLWSIVEPQENVFDFSVIDEVLDKCKKSGQTLMLRIMQHTARACEDIPAWLKKKVACPERPDEERIKGSPTDDYYYIAFCNLIKELGSRYDGNPLIYAVDISLSGAWGEGEGYDKVDPKILEMLIDSYTSSFKKTHLLGQICAPELVVYGNKTRPVGFRADGLGYGYHMRKYLPRNIYPMRNAWEKSPVAFESYWYLAEWQRQGWDIDYIIEQSLKWHVSSMNGKSSTIPFEWKEKVESWIKKMGYRFAIRGIEYPAVVKKGSGLPVELYVDNLGVAPIYNYVPVRFKLVNAEKEYVINTNIDIRKWMPADTIEKFDLSIPKDIEKSTYDIQVSIGGFDGYPLIYIATETVNENGWYYLGQVDVE